MLIDDGIALVATVLGFDSGRMMEKGIQIRTKIYFPGYKINLNDYSQISPHVSVLFTLACVPIFGQQ